MIKRLTLNYDAVNGTNTFTSGNTVQGRVFLEVTKVVMVSCFYINLEGGADVSWTTGSEDSTTYHDHVRYFKRKHIFIKSVQGCYAIRPGTHGFPFSFQLPNWDLPPSFEGSSGSVKYLLESTLKVLSGKSCTVKAALSFVPVIRSGGALLMNPQIAATGKRMKLFTSGRASLKTTIDKMGYIPGDVIKVCADVDNSSSRALRLEYTLKQKQIFTAKREQTSSSKTVFSVVGQHIPSGSKQTINADLKIPPNLKLTITNCAIIKVLHILKVRLIIPYSKDLIIKFPLVILHASQLSTLQPSVQPCGIPNDSRSSIPPHQAPFGPNHPPQAPFGPNHPPQAAIGPNPPSQSAIGPNPPSQSAIGPNPPPQAAVGPNPPPQAAFEPNTPGAASAPAPRHCLSLYPLPAYSQTANPESPPPSYTDIYPHLTHKF